MTKRTIVLSIVLVAVLVSAVAGVASAASLGAAAPLNTDNPASSAEVTVIIATGLNFPDALSGGLLSSACDAPLLLVLKDSVPTPIAAEITRIGAKRAIILGSEGVVSSKVVTALRGLGVTTIERVQGGNRYATSAAIAARAGTAVEQARQARLAEIQDVVTETIEPLEDAITDGLADLQSQIDTIDGRLDVVEGLQSSIDVIADRLDALEAAVSAIDGHISDAVSTAVAGVQSQIDALVNRVEAAEGETSALDGRLAAVEASMALAPDVTPSEWLPADVSIQVMPEYERRGLEMPSDLFRSTDEWGLWDCKPVIVVSSSESPQMTETISSDNDQILYKMRIDGSTYLGGQGGEYMGVPAPTEGAEIEVEYWASVYGQRVHGSYVIPSGWEW